jgi:hypothetical protein
MRKPARVSLTVSIPKSLEHDLRQAAMLPGRSFESVIEICLRDGLEQLGWEDDADNLIDRVNKARSTPGLTGRQRRTIREIGLAELAGSVMGVTSKQPRAVST